MFGTLRLCLALVVMYSHLGVTIAGFNPGVSAVVIFFLLAGRVSAHLLKAFGNRALAYYAERAVRIYPAYLCVLLLAAAIWMAAPVASPFLPPPDGADWLANLFIAPLDFRLRWNGDHSGVLFDAEEFTLIPPAWSLGLELQFYLVAPLLMGLTADRRARVLAASLVVWVMAGMGVIDTDVWGYRLLPGVLFVFLAGMEMHDRRYGAVATVWLVGCLMYGAILVGALAARPFNVETSLGLVVGIPLLMGCSRLPQAKFDHFLGGLSYPAFLFHFPLMWLFESAGYKPDNAVRHFLLLCVVLCASALLYRYVDRPLQPFRRAFRNRFRPTARVGRV
ncbi:acyltransferase family protein [Methylocystis echinoides]|uniref:Acyltransferase 3 domain-containing protein n=1 Tax=Methylocystis echinoides TaxID=29468 RepID=A0A9W6GVZ8_9HYPH|nr:acyltransferase [Methylocystis echinoides]GLI93904.1 hypothetical protein LMG27198_28960 [Methylocystis echinoides]